MVNIWKRIGVMIVAWFIIVPSEACATIYVSKGGDNTNGSSWKSALNTIGAAIIVASPGEEVWVSKGTYSEDVKIGIAIVIVGGFEGTEETLDSRPHPFGAFNTIIAGGTDSAIVDIRSVCILDGITIRKGENGTAVGCLIYHASATLRCCTLAGNVSNDLGGGGGALIGFSKVHLVRQR